MSCSVFYVLLRILIETREIREGSQMDADDFQDLYKLLRGSRCAVAVLDARALFVERKMARATSRFGPIQAWRPSEADAPLSQAPPAAAVARP